VSPRFRAPFGVVVTDRHGRALWGVGTGRPSGPLPSVRGHDGTRHPLGRLATREQITAAIEGELERVRRGGPPGCLALVDLDDFKGVNDRVGHAAGDLVLQQVADVVLTQARTGEVVGRVGGDEIAIVLHGTSVGDAVTGLRRIVGAIMERVVLPDGSRVTASAGVTRLDPSVRHAEVLFGYATNAVHYAKAFERGGVAVARKGLSAELRRERLALAAAASTDQRTGLANAARFEEDWESLHRRSFDAGGSYGLLLVDVDRFHAYNRIHGLRAGNETLRAVAGALVEAAPGGTVYRYGGEEFAVLVPAASAPSEVHAVGAAMVAAVRDLRRPHEGREDGSTIVTVTAAGAFVDDGGTDRYATFDRIDNALVGGKAAGRDRYVSA
jgi:diguanylate cyclase (GGDEF)-like protein